jgi:glycosyltransferase involved in cell wall biosynthesis
LIKKAEKAERLFQAGKYFWAAWHFHALYKADRRCTSFIAGLLKTHHAQQKSLDVTLRLFDKSTDLQDHAAVLTAISAWSEQKGYGSRLDILQRLVDFIANAHRFGIAEEQIRDTIQNLLKFFPLQNGNDTQLAIEWLASNQTVHAVVDQEVLIDRVARWLTRIYRGLPQSEQADFVAKLPQKRASYALWPWSVMQFLDFVSLDPVLLNRIPPVDELPCVDSTRFARLWSKLQCTEDQEPLLIRYALHAWRVCGDEPSRIVANRTLAQSGDMGLIEFPLADDEWPILRRIIVARIREQDFGLDDLPCCLKFVFSLHQQIGVAGNARSLLELIAHRSGEISAFDQLDEQLLSCQQQVTKIDPVWPIRRLLVLRTLGVEFSSQDLRSANSQIELTACDNLSDFRMICGELNRLGLHEELEAWSAQAMDFVSDSPLAILRCLSCQQRKDYAGVIAAAEVGLRLSCLHPDSSGRFFSMLFQSIHALDRNAANDPIGQFVARLQPVANHLRLETEALDQLNRLVRGDTSQTNAYLSNLFQQESELDHRRYHKISNHFLAALRNSCSNANQLRVLRRFDADLLPPEWKAELARCELVDNQIDRATELIEQALEAEPENHKALQIKVRVALAQMQTTEALAICDRILAQAPHDAFTKKLYLRALLSSNASPEQILAPIQQWTQALKGDAARNFEIEHLIFANLPKRAFLKSWQWRSETNDRSLTDPAICNALMELGEYGLAFEFADSTATDSQQTLDEEMLEEVGSSNQQLQDILKYLDFQPLSTEIVLECCQQLAEAIESEAMPVDLTQWADESRRAKFPESILKIASAIAPAPQRNAGPICLVSSSLGLGGAERQISYTAIGLARKIGAERVVVVCHNLGEVRNRSFFEQQILSAHVAVMTSHCENEDVPQSDHPEVQRLLENLPQHPIRSALIRYYRAFAEIKPAVVYTSQDNTNIIGGFAALLAGVPRIVMSGRSQAREEEQAPWNRFAYRKLLEHSHVTLTTNSHAGARDYAQWLDIPNNSIPVIHNGFDFDLIDQHLQTKSLIDFRSQWNVPADALVIGAVMRMNEVKRPYLWLDLVTALQEQIPNLYGVFIGDGPLWQEVSQRASQSAFADRLRFPGAISPVEPAMTALDLLLLTSRSEGLPNVLVEAQAVGTLVASTDVGGAAETFVPGTTGILLKGEPQMLTEQLIAFIQSQTDWQTARAQARQFAREHFSLEKMLASTVEILGIGSL